MKKKILGIVTVLIVIFANMYLTLSDNTLDRLLVLNNVESLAHDENILLSDRYKVLGSYLCNDGSYYKKCIGSLKYEEYCLPTQETNCPVGTESNTNVVNPGNTDIIAESCSSLGHIWNISADFKWCSRCGLKIKI